MYRKSWKDHKCTVPESSSHSFLPVLDTKASQFQRFRRAFKKWTLIDESNPRTAEFSLSNTEILSMRQQQVQSDSCIVHPFSRFRMFYEMYMCVVFLFCHVYMPLDAVFDTTPHIRYSRYINTIFDVACLIDVVMWFFTGYADVNEKRVYMDPKKIAKHYIFFSHFFCDVLSSIPDPALYAHESHTTRALEILGLLKSTRIITSYCYASRTADYWALRNTFIRICIVGFFVFLVFHWTACFFVLVPEIRIFLNGAMHRSSWRYTWNLMNTSTSHIYLLAFYKTSGYILGVQFTRKETITWDEKLFSCLIYCTGKVFLLYLTVILVNTLLSLRSLETKYCEVMSQVNGFMDRKRLSAPMRSRVVQNYVFKYNRMFIQEHKITELLSDQMKKEINAELLQKLVANVRVFERLSSEEIEQVLSHLKSEVYLPGDIIIKHGTAGDCMYFLASGTVSVSTPSGKEVCHLQDGDYFGEICVIYRDKKRTANVIALEICKVYRMSKRGFQTCFKDNRSIVRIFEFAASERRDIIEVYEEIAARAYKQLSAEKG